MLAPLRRLWLALCCAALFGCAAQTAYRQGQASLNEGKLADAVEQFDQASRLEPGSAEYRIAHVRTRDRLVAQRLAEAEQARDKGLYDQAENAYHQVLQIAGANERALSGLRQLEGRRRWQRLLREAESAAQRNDWETVRQRARTVLAESPTERQALELLARATEAAERAVASASNSRGQALATAYRKPISIEFRDAPLKTVFEVISRSSGLNFVFDKDVRGDQKTSIFLRNSTIEAAVKMVLLSNQLELRVLDVNSILVFPNTPAKQKELQELSVRTFYLTNADARTVAATLKTLLKLRDVVTDDKLNLVIVRDAPEALRVAERLVAVHDAPEAEVMLEVEILEVKRTRLLDLGVRWPDTLSLMPLPSATSGTLTLSDLRNINQSSLGVSIGSGAIVAKKIDTDANILANPRIRARNREKAKIHIGERVPNITTTSTSTGFVSESVNYVDVGLKLDVEPTVYLDNEVAIKISLEVSSIISQIQTKSGTLAYQIGTRTASTVLRLKDGENQVLAGLINDEDRRTANKVPLLGEAPILGRLFGSQADDGSKTEIVLSITPRVLRNVQRPGAELQEFESGTESNVGARLGGGTSGAAPAGAPPAAAETAPAPIAPAPSAAPSTSGGDAAGAKGDGTAATVRRKVAPGAALSGATLQLNSLTPLGPGKRALPVQPLAPQTISIIE